MTDLAIEIIDSITTSPLESQKILRDFTQDFYQDSDSTLTKEEIEEIKDNIESGFIKSKDIDWEHLEDLEL